MNVVVVVNQASSNSLQLGNYYCEKRGVPPQNVLPISWSGAPVEWALSDYTNVLLNPFLSMLSSRQLTNQIDYVVLSMDIPYRITDGTNGWNSTTSSLFYGFMPDTRDPFDCPLANGSSNRYAGSEGIFRATPPISASSNSFLVTMITASNLALAKQIVDQGVASDSTFPTQDIVLARSTDPFRNIRFQTFDNGQFNTRVLGNNSVYRTNSDIVAPVPLLGYENGLANFTVQPGNFVPGAMADSLTSFGGQIFENTGQTVLLAFLAAGATGSYGTVVEPCSYFVKFPDPQNYFYQMRGFSLAECYYQSITNPYEGLIVGEPLAAPFARPATGDWVSLATNALLSGATNLFIHFTSFATNIPLRHADLFVDGTFVQSVTNIPPKQGQGITVIINGFATNYFVPTNATVRSVTSNLTTVLNTSVYTNLTKVRAFAHGDRIELRSGDPLKLGPQVSLALTNPVFASTPTTFVTSTGSNFLDSIAYGEMDCAVTGIPDTNSFLQLDVFKTNGGVVTITVSNSVPGTTMDQMVHQLADQVSNTFLLQGITGLNAEDVEYIAADKSSFVLRARNFGYAPAQIAASLTGSTNFNVLPAGTSTLTDNLADLQPRAHLYIASGATNLSVTFPFATTNIPDGFHELAVVAYEGSHVHTQARATRPVRIQNTSLSADFTTLVGGPNTALEANLQFSVVANTNAIAKIELFSTGGSLGSVTNQSSNVFSFPATNLDLGLHPFYAMVTATSGAQYRTETAWIRLVGLDSPFLLQIGAPPPLLVWPAAAGRSYDILSATNATDTFLLRATIIPTNSLGQWTETNNAAAQQFYRVRVTP